MSGAVVPQVLVVATPGLGDRSYLVHDGAHAVVVDAQRDIDRVQALLDENGLSLAAVLETHLHNDYVSGGLALARRHGADYVVPAGVDVAFPASRAGDGHSLTVGGLTVRALHTPGHTPHHLSYVVTAGDAPGAVFSGGSLLFGSVGRSDLVSAELAEPLARAQARSVRRLAHQLDGRTAVYPTHGFGSFCSATQTHGDAATIADERAANPALTEPEDAFVAATLAGLDVFPAYYAHMGPANAEGPTAADLALPAPADPASIAATLAAGGWVVDLRSRELFAGGHVPGALSFDVDGPFVTYLAWMLPVGAPLVLLGASAEQVRTAQRELARVGVDRIAGHSVGDPAHWLAGGEPATSTRTDFAGLARALAEDPATPVVDTRQHLEWEAGHVDGAVHIPFYELESRRGEICPTTATYVYCGSGYRAAAAVSLLARHGYDHVVHVDDAFDNAVRAGLPVVTEAAPHRPPGWTWTASRASVATFTPPDLAAHR